MSHKRKSNKRNRSIKERLLILCEGETERNYFLAMREDEDFKVVMAATDIDILKAKRPNPKQIVEEALKKQKESKEQNPYSKIWLVFDHDFHANRKSAYDEAIKNKISVAFSAICFESWYLLHFIKSTRVFVNPSKLIPELKKHYSSYQKAKQNDFSNLKDNLDQAIKNAKWLRKNVENEDKHITDCNPWTDVDLLVLYLKSLQENS